jgi:predicted  nucleic acid-binding Zn-ribbon protein
MPATADNLRDLHLLHQRARALRDRLASGPKSLAARQTALTNRQAELETSRKALQDAKIQLKKHEHSLQSVDSKIDDLKVKLNQVKKNDEYKALQNQIAHDNAAKARIEEEILLCYEAIESKTAALAKLEGEAKRSAQEVASLERQIEEQAAAYTTQLREIETALAGAENTIPEDSRDRYRRIVSRYGADALAACEDGACHGCFTALTAQMINDLINDNSLSFCLSCGRLLYMAEAEVSHSRRTGK